MIAPAVLPSEYARWNRHWRAPFGRRVVFKGSWISRTPLVLKYRGLFAFQRNSLTRTFEYPWAHARIRSCIDTGIVVEIGGGLSGLQFVLAREGYDVVNIDPGLEAKGRGWAVPADRHRDIARIFDAPARLISKTIDRAELAPRSVDLVLSISTLEHLTPQELIVVADSIRQALKPGGWIVLTVDLFLGLKPFSPAERNGWGMNIDVRAFLERAGTELVEGDPGQILGFPQFDAEMVRRDRKSFLIGTDQSLAQCLVARAV